ncbi:hypothetical protein KAK07_16745 [Ideonella sp. 4Y16]|uniref:Uncharacterized protein n=1 Tax=Ideonella alba TaxID=2824118 RepID=A0A940Y9N0_9BURK|nr:hypothetical protein [Ideonella alba]MBQ0931423.1 hypothetical protein [Ideonella alba]MBQ0944989.1 hypothetical protein [Ideonella alba]
MFNSETLEVAIGMAFLFLTMSLICTAIQEWIEGIMKWRAMDLERGLRVLLNDDDGTVAQRLYEHPLIYSLFQGRYDPKKLWRSPFTPGLGSRHMRLHARRQLPSYIPSERFADALIDLVARGDGSAAANAPLTPQALRERVAQYDSPHLRRVLLWALDRGNDDLAATRQHLAQWFDGTMQRASGWYKRRTQAVLFTVGLLAAVVLNIDALHVMNRLLADRALREAAVQQASLVQDAQAGLAGQAPAQRLDALQHRLGAIGLPIGWQPGGSLPQLAPQGGLQNADPLALMMLALGWLVSAFAVMLGAPFWFDLLGRFMTLRASMKPAPTPAPPTAPTPD